jgi:hypothetical protein
MQRRPARGQSLPPEIKQQVRETAARSRFTLHKLLASLYDAGWTLRALGEAFDPPVPRTTVREWVQSAPESRQEIQPPTLKTSPASPAKPPRDPIPASDRALLALLVDDAKDYRAGMSSFSAPATANELLDDLIRRLYDAKYPVKEIAAAASLSRRAVYNRLKKTER